MKLLKTFFCAFALLCAALPASAAMPTNASFKPYDTIIPANQEITVTFTAGQEEVTSPLNVIANMVGGIGFGQDPTYLECPAINGVSKIQLDESYWGYPSYGEYSIHIGLVVFDDEGEPLMGPDGEMLTFERTYQRAVEGAAKCVLEYPNAHNWDNEGLTFSDFYNEGYCTFYFTKDVTLTGDSFGVVEYYADGYLIDEVDIVNSLLVPAPGMDPLSGMYAISVVVKHEDYTASDLSGIKVKLKRVVSEGQAVEVSPITALNNDADKKAPRKTKSSLEKEMMNNVSTVSVYNLQGMLINENMSASEVSNLPAGVYIINGKKVVIR